MAVARRGSGRSGRRPDDPRGPAVAARARRRTPWRRRRRPTCRAAPGARRSSPGRAVPGGRPSARPAPEPEHGDLHGAAPRSRRRAGPRGSPARCSLRRGRRPPSVVYPAVGQRAERLAKRRERGHARRRRRRAASTTPRTGPARRARRDESASRERVAGREAKSDGPVERVDAGRTWRPRRRCPAVERPPIAMSAVGLAASAFSLLGSYGRRSATFRPSWSASAAATSTSEPATRAADACPRTAGSACRPRPCSTPGSQRGAGGQRRGRRAVGRPARRRAARNAVGETRATQTSHGGRRARSGVLPPG